MSARALSAALALAATAIPAASLAAPPVGPAVIVEPLPLLGTGSSIAHGWNELVVGVQNNGPRLLRGKINVGAMEIRGERREILVTAPFSVGAGASVLVRVPAQVASYGDVSVEVVDEEGQELSRRSFPSFNPTGVMLFDVSEASRLRGALNDAVVSPHFTPSGAGSRGAAPTITVGSPRFDPATGDPLLPDRAALYATADAVVMRSETLARVSGAELDALAGYVLAGGTLAVAVTRPEDLRHPTLVAFAGGPIMRQGVSSTTLAELVLPEPSSGLSSSSKLIPPARAPASDLIESLSGYMGGNLHGSVYGSSAAYGLGEVHLLAFDPTRKPAVDDPWAQARMVDLARRAFDRRSTQIFRPGMENPSQSYSRVRQELDPNESSRWAIAAASLLLIIYAIVAGPVNFTLAARAGRPLRALRWLPIFAAVAFALVVGIGVAAKGVTGRARHLTLIEAGAGMPKGTARRFRGFYASRAQDLTVRTTDAGSVLSTVVAELSERRDHLVVDRDGVRLAGVSALPWQTVVVREDGFASLGDGIAMVKEGESDVAVVNRTGRDLRGVILRAPGGALRYLHRLKDGERASTATAPKMSATTAGATWEGMLGSTWRAGGVDLHRLYAHALKGVLDEDAPGLAEAWRAIEDAAAESVDWFPEGAAVLLGQIDGGEGRLSDSGLRIERDRLLVRVVGFGGAPVTEPAKVEPPYPAIRVRHLWHRFGALDVVRDVTFDVAPGEIFGFIGPNGAGKTTTIRVMATLLEPMAGRVEVDGIDVTIDPEEVRRRIGYMPDHAGVYERVTVREYLEFFADAFRVPSLSVVDAVLELTDLGRIQDKIVATMSKGMKQRLQLGRILLHDPKVLILDEPASDLDPRARIEIRDLLLELRGLGKTIFLSSHILTELSDVCTSIGILERGRLIVAGPIGEIATRLEAVRAAQAVGHAPPQQPGAPVYAGPPDPSARAEAYAPGTLPIAPPQQPAAPRRKVKVRVLGDPAYAAYLVRGGPGIVDADVVGGVVHVGFTGPDQKIAEIVQHLVRNGVGVIGVEPERNELERIFLEVTRGEMQ